MVFVSFQFEEWEENNHKFQRKIDCVEVFMKHWYDLICPELQRAKHSADWGKVNNTVGRTLSFQVYKPVLDLMRLNRT